MKQCSKCREKKNLDCFYKNSKRSDGVNSYCKDCMRLYGKEYYQSERKGKWEIYRDIEKLKRFMARHEAHAEDLENFIGKNDACRKIFAEYLRSGRIRRPSRCEECGRGCKPDGHHVDYSKPLFVVWLCEECHKKEHKKS